MMALKSFITSLPSETIKITQKASGSERRLMMVILFHSELLLSVKEGQESTSAVY